MKISFDPWHWKGIMQRASDFISPYAARKSLVYVLLICENNFCTAFASDPDGYTFFRMRVPCKMEDQFCRFAFLVKPEKVPAKCVSVSVETPQVIKDNYIIKIQYGFLGSTEAGFTESVQEIPDDPALFPDFEKSLNHMISNRKEEFTISLKKDVLLRALSAFKGKEKNCTLIFHFGNEVNPAIIDTYKDDEWPETRVVICPVRIFNGGME